MLAKLHNLFSPLSLSRLGYSLTNTYILTQTYTLLTMQSDKTVVLHLSMLFMRKRRFMSDEFSYRKGLAKTSSNFT